ncbi:methylmalonyl-CoA mutase subunit beta [Sinomicrobium soli]|uniref:methylmalonyl-CoA mutase subunit beta n=1 Tax=Sinomicrobium sp. N-1-3-6 TaxID=2219864 RepID=UPI000DCF37CC|nr:methylmalonyl-CoA mutase subunit beta [Sinomicrobium sp. N-1-3-6]RAV30432.1 methylmalonyl-CoA mutase [Sinomicrobium sp. N-1-3-6]
MDQHLFDEFPWVSAKMWKQKIQFDLQGDDYNTLIGKTAEGINIKPFYHADDLPGPLPGITPGQPWQICQKIYAGNEKAANKKALRALENGAESLWFVIPREDTDISLLLRDIDRERTTLHLEPEFLSASFPGIAGKGSGIYLHNDSIGRLARSGNWYYNLGKDFEILSATAGHSEKASLLSVDAALYHNAGATAAQQLAYALAHANEYLNTLQHSDALKTHQFLFRVALGPDYFLEIAKLRAWRILWKTLASEYNARADCHILAFPGTRNKTLYDYNVNMLRTTTECMSAVLGGADTICNLPYDSIYHKDNEFAERIARNQLLILKHESYMGEVLNPADGTYYIEELTLQLAGKALDIFKQIEAGGGFLKQLKDHVIQKKIRESAAEEQKAFDEGRKILVGTNKYPNPDDRMKDELELFPFTKTNRRKTLIAPVAERRLSEKTEQERLQTENPASPSPQQTGSDRS